MKLIATHLLNDYSGSPKVLMQLIKGWVKNDIQVELHTCDERDGFLSDLQGVNYTYFQYRWAANPITRLVNLILSQISLLFNILKTASREDIIYVNTVLPFGAALAGKIKGCKVIYHIHETSVKPAILKSFLFGIVRWCATDVIYVSNYLASTEPIQNKQSHILHNAIENDFLLKAQQNTNKSEGLKNILMVCSLKEYKGVNEFITIASHLPNHSFKLVLNASQEEIDTFFGKIQTTDNITLYTTQSDVHPFYKWADVVLNLSHPSTWIETFGLTIIEGMAYGNPAIVPTVGGVTEVVTEGQNGALISSERIDEIIYRIAVWSTNTKYFDELREAAKINVASFSEDVFISKNIQILNL